MLVSALFQHESAIGICMSPPSWASLLPHPTPLGSHRPSDLSSLHLIQSLTLTFDPMKLKRETKTYFPHMRSLEGLGYCSKDSFVSSWGLTEHLMGLPCSSDGKESACNAEELGSIPGSGRSSGEGNGNPFQYCLENPMDRGAWQGTVHWVANSWTRLRD